MRATLLLLLALAGPSYASVCTSQIELDTRKFTSEIGSRKIAFVATNLSGKCWVTDVEAANRRHPPWSTFKIPHLLIALDSGAASSLDEPIQWSATAHPAQPYWPADWARTQTLESAFERSVPWYFQELIPRVGASNYRKWLKQFGYGNHSVEDGDTSFWLAGSLRISPLEQLGFLSCILSESRCGASRRAVEALDTVALQDKAGGLRLYAKTGSGPLRAGDFDGPFEGWYVGYVRDQDNNPIAAFALYAQGESFDAIRSFRRAFSLRLLTHINQWPTQ